MTKKKLENVCRNKSIVELVVLKIIKFEILFWLSLCTCAVCWVFLPTYLELLYSYYYFFLQQITNTKVEGQITLQRAIVEERKKKEQAIQQAVAQVKSDLGEKGDQGITVVTYEAWNQAQSDSQIMVMEDSDTKTSGP